MTPRKAGLGREGKGGIGDGTGISNSRLPSPHNMVPIQIAIATDLNPWNIGGPILTQHSIVSCGCSCDSSICGCRLYCCSFWQASWVIGVWGSRPPEFSFLLVISDPDMTAKMSDTNQYQKWRPKMAEHQWSRYNDVSRELPLSVATHAKTS